AIYPPGAGYRKHLDRFADSNAREVTFVTYLNREWKEEDGGLLRLYSETAPGLVTTEIVPRLGTTAFFLSGSIWHEVTATARRRYSATGWFRSDGFTAPRRQELP
ncbi:MAG: 2OG-Fe(II) oxygenase, partial [Chrysiogenetes bacterium]|nr:2OG-Fe(II) oxygenase [Chrysiogenetes bacterium]